jgi:hypothetical protein
MVDILKLRDQLDLTLKDYGVDWKLENLDEEGPNAYYNALVEDLVVTILREVKK